MRVRRGYPMRNWIYNFI